jgi:hypothetical protein
MNVILVQKYQVKNAKIEKTGPSKSMKLEEFKKNWNNYPNTGIPAAPTKDWVDDT